MQYLRHFALVQVDPKTTRHKGISQFEFSSAFTVFISHATSLYPLHRNEDTTWDYNIIKVTNISPSTLEGTLTNLPYTHPWLTLSIYYCESPSQAIRCVLI